MEQKNIFPEIVKTLVSVIEEKDVYARGHSLRVAQGSVRIAKRLNFSKPEQDRLFLAGLLHDIGMVYVPLEILTKPDPLTPEERQIMQKHPLVAEKILGHLSMLQPLLPFIRHHHENYDGTGYPDGLQGNAIPLGARILTVVDCYDALISPRPHRTGKTSAEALQDMLSRSGIQFDPTILKLFAALLMPDQAQPEQTSAAPPQARREKSLPELIGAVIKKVQSGQIELPVLPAVINEIQKIIKSPIATTEALAAAIEKDAVISLKLIATANSSLYRGAKKVLTVREAVPRLGLKQTQSVVNAIANRGLYETKNEEFSAFMERLWKHALASAYAARSIAKQAKLEDFERFFLYGLTHDIGKVLMLRALLDKRNAEDSGAITVDAMQPLLQQTHAEFGSMLLGSWGFSADFKNVALQHESGDYKDTTPPEVLAVNLANMLTRTIGYSLFDAEGVDLSGLASAKRLSLDAAAIEAIAADVQKTMLDTPQSF